MQVTQDGYAFLDLPLFGSELAQKILVILWTQ